MSRFALPLVLLLTALTAGCTGLPDTRGPFPPGAELVSDAAKSFASVRGVHFAAGVNGVLPGFPLRQIEGDATLDDGESANGTADVQDDDAAGGHVKFHFTVNGQHVRTDLGAGPLPDAYTVSRFLGAHGGLKRLLDAVTDARTEGRENVDGASALRVGGRVPAAVAHSVLAQVDADLNVKVWVSDSLPRRFVRLWAQIPPPDDNLSPVMIELSLTKQQA